MNEQRVDWDAYDWEGMTDAEIARECGRTRSRVGQIRHNPRKLRPECTRKNQRGGTAKDKISEMSGKQTAKMTREEVAKLAGCEAEYAEQCLRAASLPYKIPEDQRWQTKYAWLSITHDQWMSNTDPEIAVILGVDNPGVVSQWRRRNGILKKPARVKVAV